MSLSTMIELSIRNPNVGGVGFFQENTCDIHQVNPLSHDQLRFSMQSQFQFVRCSNQGFP